MRKLAISLLRIPLTWQVTSFKLLSRFSLSFDSLIKMYLGKKKMYLGVGHWVYSTWSSWVSLMFVFMPSNLERFLLLFLSLHILSPPTLPPSWLPACICWSAQQCIPSPLGFLCSLFFNLFLSVSDTWSFPLSYLQIQWFFLCSILLWILLGEF